MGNHLPEPGTWLADTKFHPPLLRADVIPRPRLLDALHDAVFSHPLTLISAPAGYGKTTLLTDFGFRIANCGLGPTDEDQIRNPKSEIRNPVAWLSLDAEDNDPARFLTALIVALQRLDPACGATAQTLLAGRASPGVEAWRVVSVLINDVLETLTDPFALILDDLHRISEPAIFAALDYLLEHMPAHMHLVAGTRVDPPLALARLRARGQVAELRLADLRFTTDETTAFLNDRLGLHLSPDEVAVLHARTEGWPAGLRLLASPLSRLSSGPDRRAFIEHLAHTDRLVFDFLAEEVLNQQESEIRMFLLQTAILSELTPALCQAVTRRDDAGALLEEVYRRNLFVVAVGPQEKREKGNKETREKGNRGIGESLVPFFPYPLFPSYRYHDLFAEFLRHRLQQELAERVPELHLRAARAESDPARAVGHYLAAASWHEAAEAIEQVGAMLLPRGHLDTLNRWINALPASVCEAHPRLIHYLAVCAWQKDRLTEAQSLLEQARQGFELAGDDEAPGEMLANLAHLALQQAEWERSGALIDRALAHPTRPHTGAQLLMGRASLKLSRGDWAGAERDFKDAVELVQQSGEVDLLSFLTTDLEPAFAFLPGGLEAMERLFRQARAQVGDQISPLRLGIENMLTILHLFRGEFAEAIHAGEQALAIRQRLGGKPFAAVDAAMLLVAIHGARGDYAAAEPLFDLLPVKSRQKPVVEAMKAAFLYLLGRVYWLHDRLEEARRIYERMCAAEDPREVPAARVCRTWMWSLLEMADGRYEEAERALRRPEVLEPKDLRARLFGSTRLMLARLYLEQNRRREALAELAPALAYHEQLGIPGPILAEGSSIVPLLRLAVEQGVEATYAARLLELLGADDEPRPVHVPHTGETLTPREVEVLRLIVAGYSNRAIADHLVISEWTVKSHLTHIYRRLDVASRTQAVARARELGLG